MKTYHEEQRFTQWWIWALFMGSMISVLFMMWWSNTPVEGSDFFIMILVLLLVIIMFKIIKLETSIDEKQIQVRFFPFVVRTVQWAEVEEAGLITYGFVGGWGIRLGTRYGTVYNIRGREGLAVTLTDGRRFLVGTQKPSELRTFLDEIQRARVGD